MNPSSIDHGSFDGDGDGLPDSWEETFGLNNTLNDAGQDVDSDGLSNLQELTAQTNPLFQIRMGMDFRTETKFRPILQIHWKLILMKMDSPILRKYRMEQIQ